MIHPTNVLRVQDVPYHAALSFRKYENIRYPRSPIELVLMLGRTRNLLMSHSAMQDIIFHSRSLFSYVLYMLINVHLCPLTCCSIDLLQRVLLPNSD